MIEDGADFKESIEIDRGSERKPSPRGQLSVAAAGAGRKAFNGPHARHDQATGT